MKVNLKKLYFSPASKELQNEYKSFRNFTSNIYSVYINQNLSIRINPKMSLTKIAQFLKVFDKYKNKDEELFFTPFGDIIIKPILS